MSEASLLAKRAYVGALRLIRGAVRPFGVLEARPDPARARLRHWLHSLLAIHDVDELIRLDVPWWTYAAIADVDAFLAARPGARVFEYGSGASTVWLARRAGTVHSVDHDRGWVDILTPRLAALGNVALRVVEADAAADPDPLYRSDKPGWRGRTFRAYAGAIDQVEGAFDLIVVDGRARPACLARAAARLAPGGMVVFDNSHRARYRAAISGCGLARTVTRGLVPSLPVPDETTLLRRPDGR